MTGRSTFSWRAVMLSALLGGVLGYVMFARSQTFDVSPRLVTTRPGLYPDELDTVRLFKTAAPSVVYITTTKHAEVVDAGGQQADKVKTGTGSGFVWDEAGHIVTNFHVIGDFDTAEVHDDQGNLYPADVIGVSPENDLAVLKIAPNHALQPIPLGTSGDLQVGQKVFAIGDPFGLDWTLTTGIVSAVGRAIPFQETGQPIENVIQTDAAINPGNSGGPLLDSAGRLIGVNAALYSTTGTNLGIGFAVPVDTVNRVVPQLISAGRGRASLGLIVHDGLSEQFRQFQNARFGVVIVRVLDGSAAQAAGLRPAQRRSNGILLGDVVLKIDDKPVNSAEDVEAIVNKHKPGDTLVLTIFRDRQFLEKKVMLDSSMKAQH